MLACSRRGLQQVHHLLRFGTVNHRDRRDIGRLVAKGDAQSQASSSGNTKTQKMTSGSRHSSCMRIGSRRTISGPTAIGDQPALAPAMLDITGLAARLSPSNPPADAGR